MNPTCTVGLEKQPHKISMLMGAVSCHCFQSYRHFINQKTSLQLLKTSLQLFRTIGWFHSSLLCCSTQTFTLFSHAKKTYKHINKVVALSINIKCKLALLSHTVLYSQSSDSSFSQLSSHPKDESQSTM